MEGIGHTSRHPIATIEHVFATRFVHVAALTLSLYDHCLTFEEEVELVWKGANPRSWPRLIFLAARYACPISLIINTFALFGTNTHEYLSLFFFLISTDKQFSCQGWLLFHGWSGFVFFAGIQVISQMRLWAMYRSRNVLVSMTVFVSIALMGMGLLEGFGYADLNASGEPVSMPIPIHICGPGPRTDGQSGPSLPHYVYAFWIPPLIVEIVTLILVAWKAFLYYRGNTPREWAGSRLMVSIVRYSVFYFLVVLALYLANLYIWARLPTNAFELMIPLTYALPSIAGNRMLLSLRSVFYDKYAELPAKNDTIGLKALDPERGLTVTTHNPFKEFESFFGEREI
ncbi:hypothetical protein M422DRAFT_239677 [Sphaerobolus stellatus SS14]|nr:hypothetical protein M422DRAFT_239677 [Sphaerobolus stellatus SS14]